MKEVVRSMKDIMKKAAAAAIVSASALLCGVSASADVIWEEPVIMDMPENPVSAMEKRTYYAVKDCVSFDSPSGNEINRYKAGDTFVCAWKQTDEYGTEWYGFKSNKKKEWISSELLALSYDSASFMEEHGEELADYGGELDDYSAEGKPIYLWEYPGGYASVKMEQYPEEWNTDYISQVYEDSSGKWGYIAYIWGEEGWIYMNDPTDPSPAFADRRSEIKVESGTAAYYENIAAASNGTESGEDINVSGYAAGAVLAAAAAGLSAVILSLMKKKKSD